MRRLFPDPAEDVDILDAYTHAPGVVRVNMVASADGAATVEGRSGGLSTTADHQLFLALRTLADVVLVGASTVRTENYGGAKPNEVARARRVASGLAEFPPIAVVSRSLDLDPAARFFTDTAIRPIIITVDDADDARARELADVADVVRAGVGTVDLDAAIDVLADRGLTRVLSEGGPVLLGELLHAGRVNELALTVAPLLTGGHAKRITDGPLADPPVAMQLAHVCEQDQSLFLLFRRGVPAQPQ